MKRTHEALIEAMDRFNALMQAEIKAAPPLVALELADIKFKVNLLFDRRRRASAEHTVLTGPKL